MLSVDGIPSENGIFQEVSQEVKNLQEDIKTGKFKNAYLLFGEEAYLKIQYKEKLIHALNPDDDTMNFTKYEGKGIEVREMIDLCETMPFFADHRVVLVENSGFFKNKCDELADYMKTLPDYLRLVFVEEEVDKRSRMYKAVKNCGRIVEFAKQDEKTLMRWAAGILAREGRKITTRDMELFLTKTGTDMGNIRMELEKLITYTMGQDIVTREDIEEICTTRTENKIFDMVRAVTERNQRRALDLYNDLLTLREPPMRILFLLSKQFHTQHILQSSGLHFLLRINKILFCLFKLLNTVSSRTGQYISCHKRRYAKSGCNFVLRCPFPCHFLCKAHLPELLRQQ